MELNRKVLLLALLKKSPQESFLDILLMLESAKVFTLKEGKGHLKALKKEGFIERGILTPKGMAFAKEVEKEFRL